MVKNESVIFKALSCLNPFFLIFSSFLEMPGERAYILARKGNHKKIYIDYSWFEWQQHWKKRVRGLFESCLWQIKYWEGLRFKQYVERNQFWLRTGIRSHLDIIFCHTVFTWNQSLTQGQSKSCPSS